MFGDIPPPKGMRVTSGSIVIEKRPKEKLIGISIGGGSPSCPCLYIVQVFEDTAVSRDGTLESGDELVSINGACLRSSSRADAAKMIQESKESVTINYNKLHIDQADINQVEIAAKKLKHRIVENLSSSVADAIGFSRAVLVNDTLINHLQVIKNKYSVIKSFIHKFVKFIHCHGDLASIYRTFGDSLTEIGMRESQISANEAFCKFGSIHRSMEKHMVTCIKTLNRIIEDSKLFNDKAIPDMNRSLDKYLNCKFEYLSYCLKIKEMDDEEYNCFVMQEILYRIDTGNYEYRALLRHRQNSKIQFSNARHDILIKLDLFNNKYMQDMTNHLQNLMQAMIKYYKDNCQLLRDVNIFPIDLDIRHTTFNHNPVDLMNEEIGEFCDDHSNENDKKTDETDSTGSEKDLKSVSNEGSDTKPINKNMSGKLENSEFESSDESAYEDQPLLD